MPKSSEFVFVLTPVLSSCRQNGGDDSAEGVVNLRNQKEHGDVVSSGSLFFASYTHARAACLDSLHTWRMKFVAALMSP